MAKVGTGPSLQPCASVRFWRCCLKKRSARRRTEPTSANERYDGSLPRIRIFGSSTTMPVVRRSRPGSTECKPSWARRLTRWRICFQPTRPRLFVWAQHAPWRKSPCISTTGTRFCAPSTKSSSDNKGDTDASFASGGAASGTVGEAGVLRRPTWAHRGVVYPDG